MEHLYCVAGYGIPKNIFNDEHYNHYLKAVFNHIFSEAAGAKATIIFSGGPTDMYKPYRRTEAAEMKKFFQKMAQRSFVRKASAGWRYVLEPRSLSTLENVLYSFQLLHRKKIRHGAITVFCEYTRVKKVATFCKKIFNKNFSFRVVPIDFDVSQNRYDTDLVQKKEAKDIKLGLWALREKSNLKKYRQLFKDKVAYLRTCDPRTHPAAINQWWKSKLNEFNPK